MSERFTVAIDGPAASGKGTISRAVAARLGFAHLDTGLLYRAVGARMLEGQEPVEAARSLDPSELDEERLRTGPVAQAASQVAALPEVRQALTDFQRAFARRAGGAVLDGRDIGTVICPEAEAKLFVTASPECRAERRYKELSAKGYDVTEDSVLEDVRARDARDSERAVAPMRPAEDAVEIDTTTLSIEEAIETALAVIEARRPAVRGDGAAQ
ncbi:(d)CMP kinase [Histidinibacterium aquaticum]|uniref:Cytidylate kinase n=1 Tax=Histidinibacterium aquaticum TaxID=2613962 RepID=A0A5J5GAP7_9RHOB|nr:(d)CMP kinase [Histidinibacterium aquaticum]KAA9005187.1 (d)CMP kinase [Histidinibacterium aquaticum]